MRIILFTIYAGLIFLLIPWLPVAVWCGAFVFGDPMPEEIGALFLIGKVIPSFVLAYPILMVHGVVLSWRAYRHGKSSGMILIRALYPILIPVLLIIMLFGYASQNAELDNVRLEQLLSSAQSFDRGKYGFSPIQPSDDFRIQRYGNSGYDVMLHINGALSNAMLNKSGKTSRTVAFRKTPGGYQWVGDQEVFIGPNQYSDDFGTYYENITLTYETEKITGFPVDRLNISYSGTDSRLTPRPNLDEIGPILKDWDYLP